MSHPDGTPEDRFAAIVELLGGYPNVTPPTGQQKRFGSTALKIDNRIFAMLSRDKLVVKLPRQRVDSLVAAGAGVRFDPGHGRLMKEWLAVDALSEADWLLLATEAMNFVASRR